MRPQWSLYDTIMVALLILLLLLGILLVIDTITHGGVHRLSE